MSRPRPKPVRTWPFLTLVIGLVVGLTVLPVVVCLGWLEYGDDIQQYQNRKPFDPAAWKQTRDSDRYDLSWDLYHGRLDGLTPAEVRELLGEPSATEPDGTHWYYHLGAEKYEFQIGLAAALLHVAFENGRVVRVYKSFH